MLAVVYTAVWKHYIDRRRGLAVYTVTWSGVHNNAINKSAHRLGPRCLILGKCLGPGRFYYALNKNSPTNLFGSFSFFHLFVYKNHVSLSFFKIFWGAFHTAGFALIC